MISVKNMLKLAALGILALLAGCQPEVPKNALAPDANVLAQRAMQTRRYNTMDEKNILSASVAALQDMGFTLEDSESKLGLVVASKEADATDKTQHALVVTSMMLGALAGNMSTQGYEHLDDIQKVRAALITHVNRAQKNTQVRLSFQRIVWNKKQQISKMETLKEPTLYQGFFDRLSKSVFLEEHQI